MCGIVGYTSARGKVDPDLLIRMRDTMQHRGPDDAGVWCSTDRRIGLAHRRLAIIDLSPAGHQPMESETGDVCITFNGEIYNFQALRRDLQERGHAFRTRSDTEVILEAYRAWGTDCVTRLSGMFAFAIYDAPARRLFLARDRAGEKPLFYRHTSHGFAFASELKALMADPDCPRELNWDGLNYYLTYGYVPGALCILNGMEKLPQGHALTYCLEDGGCEVWQYWRLPEPGSNGTRSETAADLALQLEELLEDSVRRQLVSDVPVGVMLSGGIDSSLITAMAARVSSKPIKTFTIAFPGHKAYDEAPHARLVSTHFGTKHTELEAEPATIEILPELARQYDEPLADSSMVPMYLVSRLIRRHATVALGGDGGDELFGGYLHYDWVRRQQRVRRLLPKVLRNPIGALAGRIIPMGVRGRNYLIGMAQDTRHGIACANTFFDPMTRQRLLAPLAARGVLPGPTPEQYKAALCSDGQSYIQQATRVDFQTYLVDDILVKVDRASMLTSLEVRAPILDPRIIELAFNRVPDSLRAVEGERKILPRAVALRVLPAALDLRRKQGFGIPLNDWFCGEWGKYFESVLLAKTGTLLFNPEVIRSLIAGQRRGLSNTQRIFALTMFELWRQEYRVSLPK